MKHRIGAALAAASAAFALSGCATDDYGYGGVGLGYGSGGYYGSPYYGGYGGDPYWGWYDNYYYPGSGYYMYDRGGSRHRWSDSQRRYWEGRRGDRPGRENWSGYRRDGDSANWQQRGGEAWRGRNQGLTDEQRQQRRDAWQSRRQQQSQGLTEEQRQQRREAWQSRRQQSLGQQSQGQQSRGQQSQGLTDEQRQQRRDAWQSRRQQWQGMSDEQRQQRREAWQAQRQSQGNGSGERAGRGNNARGPAWRGRSD